MQQQALSGKQLCGVCRQAASRSEGMEAGRRVPAEVARQLAGQGMFSMFVPRDLGGHELSPVDGMARLEQLAQYDAASAWVCMIGATAALGSAFIKADIAQPMFAAENRITCGIFAPNGRGYRDGDDYVVSGRWAWASGSANADYIGLGCLLTENPDDDPKTSEMRLVMAPRELIQFHDTWHTLGLKGTSSGDVELSQARIPVAHSYAIGKDLPWHDGPLYQMPYFAFLSAGGGAVALGNARAAIEDLTRFGGVKTGAGERRTFAAKSGLNRQLAQDAGTIHYTRLL